MCTGISHPSRGAEDCEWFMSAVELGAECHYFFRNNPMFFQQYWTVSLTHRFGSGLTGFSAVLARQFPVKHEGKTSLSTQELN